MQASNYPLFSGVLSSNSTGSRFVVPVYQRNYEWIKENCQKLLDDIINAAKTNEEHFVGSLVTVKVDGDNNVENYIIVDGQQRLTTLVLILQILYETLEGGKKDTLDEVLHLKKNDTIKTNQNENRLRLKLIKTDDIQLSNVLDNSGTCDEESNVVKNYRYLKKRIALENPEEVLSGIKRLTCVWIQLDKYKDKPQEVFESINSTGMDLSRSDLIRNYLLMTEENQEYLYETYWAKIESSIIDSYRVTKEVRKLDTLSEFFRYYLQVKEAKSISAKNVYTTFVKFAENGKRIGLKNSDILQDLCKYANIYACFLKGEYDGDREISYYLSCIKETEQTTHYSFLLNVFSDLENDKLDKENCKKILNFLLKYYLRRLIVNSNTNEYNKFFPVLYTRVKRSGIFDYNALLKYFANNSTIDVCKIPSDEQLIECLKSLNIYDRRNICSPLLKILENSTMDSIYAKDSIDTDLSDYTIEHIMPQKNNQWLSELVKVENWEELFNQYNNNIGNLTLSKINSEMSNKPFIEKKREMEKVSGRLTFLNKEILEKNTWSFVDIKERMERLIQRLINITRIELPESDKKDYYSLKDDLKGKKICKFAIKDHFDIATSCADMFIKMIKYCFDNYDNETYDVMLNDSSINFLYDNIDIVPRGSSCVLCLIKDNLYADRRGSKFELCRRLLNLLTAIDPTSKLADSVKIWVTD